uniref:FHA domain-containing protein n=1 Tax=Meloidogyne hapla TaxID=6305 RepID=A0A1I8BKV7_MELHA
MDVKRRPFSDQKRWITIYPGYLDAKKSTAEGRWIKKDKKDKMYPRDGFRDTNLQGRVLVQTRNDDGTFINGEFQTSETLSFRIQDFCFIYIERALLLHLAEMIPKLKSRQGSSGQDQQQQNAGSGGGKQKKKK